MGTAIPVEFVDALEEEALSNCIESVRSKTAGLNLEIYQIYALVSRSYNMGTYGWFTGYNVELNFYDSYIKYFNPEEDIKYGEIVGDFTQDLYTHFMYDTVYGGGSYMEGLKRRREAEWTLFQTGYLGYNSSIDAFISASGSINPNGISKPCAEEIAITSHYGGRPSLGDYHGGTDFGCPRGSEIYATHDGIVTYAVNEYKTDGYYGFGGNSMASYGNCIIIKSNNGRFTTLYAHCQEVLVSEGERVSQGQLIAKSGNTGSSTGPHLHFELRLDGNRVDSELYIGTDKLKKDGYLDD